jgi:colicin import membrane protein
MTLYRSALCLLVAALGLFGLAAWADDAQDIERLYRAGDVEQALQQADALIAAQPRAAPVRFLKGVMLTDLNRHREATEVFLALSQEFPELPDPLNNLAVLYAADGQLEPALATLRQALRNDPLHRAARENLGDVHLALALQAWATADDAAKAAGGADNVALKRKLRLAREIVQSPTSATAQRPPG